MEMCGSVVGSEVGRDRREVESMRHGKVKSIKGMKCRYEITSNKMGMKEKIREGEIKCIREMEKSVDPMLSGRWKRKQWENGRRGDDATWKEQNGRRGAGL